MVMMWKGGVLMKRFSKVLAILLIVTIILPGIIGVAEEPTTVGLTRLSGVNRTLTSIAVSKEVYKNGANTVVLAGYEGSADALTGTLLVATEDAPLLVLARTGVTNELKTEIKRLGAKKAYILGGNVAIPKPVETNLKSLGLDVERIKGESRYETAAKIAKGAKNTKNVFLALGRTTGNDALADALIIGAVSAKEGIPVLLTKTNEIPMETKKALKDLQIKDITIIGGSRAVSMAVKTELETMDIKVNRIYGNNRYETSTIIANKYFGDSKNLIIANGRIDFDALVGGYLGAKKDAPILLTKSNKLSDETKAYIKKYPKRSYILGGDTAITKSVFTEIDIALNPHKEEASNNGGYYIDVKLKPEDAYDIFKNKYPNAKVKELGLDKEDNSYVYEVEGIEKNKEYEIKINPSNGKIIKSKEEYTNDKLSDEIKKKDLANIPGLLKKAVEDVKTGYQLKDWNIELDDGIVEFEIEFISKGKEIEYKYNLRTGKLIKIK